MLTLSSFSILTGWWHCESHKNEYKWPVGRRSEWAQRAFPLYTCQNHWPSKPWWKRVIAVACFLLLHCSACHSLLWSGKAFSLIGKLHCIADVQLSAEWRSLTPIWNAHSGCLGICIIVVLSRVADFRVLLDHKLEVLVEAHKWREVDEERVCLLITALFVLVTDSIMFIRWSLRPWWDIARCCSTEQWLSCHFVFRLKNRANEPYRRGNSVLNSPNLALLFSFWFGFGRLN